MWEVVGGVYLGWAVLLIMVAPCSELSFMHPPISIYKSQLLAPSPYHRGLPFELYILTDIKG